MHGDVTNLACTRYDMGMELEPVDQFISIARAAQLADVSPHTLRNQARAGKLRTQKLGHDLVTSRRWLHEYLMSRDTQRGRTKPLPVDYRAPE
jgi:hypothetical protein